MIDFSQVKGIAIGGRQAVQVAQGQQVLWQQSAARSAGEAAKAAAGQRSEADREGAGAT